MSVPLLMTKLFIPSPGRYLVGRARLVEKLDQCLEPGCRLTLISAPAGFGKTTLISDWIAKHAATVRRTAWLSIDEGDNDPVIIWSYVIAALQTLQAGVGQQTLDMLAVQGADLERKLAPLINDLAQIPHPCVLVLDDYHLIRNPLIHQSVAFLIEHIPPHIHLMIASRTDPPLPLALLRGRGQLLEIRLNDLRFSDEDADSYLNAGIGLNLAAQSVQALNLKTEGWIAGLQMAALAMQDMVQGGTASPSVQSKTREAAAGFVASFSGSNRFILDYLIEEVLNRQPEPIQQFLMQTSILDRLCGPLCEALMRGSEPADQPGAQSALHYLESSNLFIFPLDQQRYWYRYHHLFADLLRKRLMQTAPEAVAELHRRAIQWYEQNGLIPSAIQHAFLLQDYRKAAALVAQVTEEMWARGEHATVLAWMDALPNEEKQPYPHLLTFQVSMLISAGKLKEAEACIPVLERYISSLENAASDEADPKQIALIGNISALRTYIASFYGDWPALFTHAQTALQNLTRDVDSGQRCGVSLVLGNAHLTEGNLESADRAFVEGIEAAKKARRPQMVLTGLSNLAVVLCLEGRLNRAAQVCQEGLQLIQQYGFDRSPMTVDIFLGWGEILRERGALEEAEPYIQRGLELALEQRFVWQTAWGYQAQARLRLAQGRLGDAETSAQAADQWTVEHNVPAHFSCSGAGLLAEILLRQGKLVQADRYLQARQILAEGVIRFPHQFEYLAYARLKLLQADEAARAAGTEVLERIVQWADAHRQTGPLVAAHLLQALLCQSRGDLEGSLAYLQRALELAEPEGYVQSFVDEGQPMAALLNEAAEQGIYPAYANRLLAAFPDLPTREEAASQPAVVPARPSPVSSPIIPLVEPLSKRELETLQLIAEGYSNKEIAQKLFISLRTVKYYSTSLYNKLGVDNRMQAVIRARELGLI